MGTSGEITVTNLKAATGVADNRLSAHHPSGAGNTTAFSDFLIQNIGGNTDPSVDNAIDGTFLIPLEVNGSTTNAEGSYNANDDWEFNNITELQKNDTIKIEVWMDDVGSGFGQYAREQIFTRPENWDITRAPNTGTSFTLDNITTYRSGSGYRTIALNLTIGDTSDAFGIFAYFKAHLNTDMPNYQTNLAFQTEDISGAAYDITLDTLDGDTDGSGITANYTVENGVPPYDVELILDGVGVQATATHQSDGSYSLKDTDGDTSQELTYTVRVTDDKFDERTDSRTYRSITQ